jgi:hypothetical protein
VNSPLVKRNVLGGPDVRGVHRHRTRAPGDLPAERRDPGGVRPGSGTDPVP